MPGRVVIVGAGPAGAALAYLLARRGAEVALVERQSDFAREFRGEAVMPSGVDAFRQMGLAEDFDRLGQARPRRLVLHRNARPVLEIDTEELVEPENLPRIVSQPEMLEMLVRRASEFPSFRFLRGVSASELIEENRRTVGVRVRDRDGTEELPADLVVGADGRGSIVRRRAGLSADAEVERFDVVWFKVPEPAYLARFGEPGTTACVFLGRGHLMFCFPSWDGRLQVAWIIDKGTFRHLRDQGVEAWVAEMADHAGPELGAHLRASIDDLAHPFVLDVVCYLLPRWTAPGVALLGDAAHPMSPVGGQGINIALRDTLVAANHLVPLFERGAAPPAGAIDDATAAFQRERYPEAETIQGMQRVPPRIIFQRTWWARAAVAVLPHLVRMQLRGGRQSAVFGRLAFGVTDVELRV